jgi:hypothetical protein
VVTIATLDQVAEVRQLLRKAGVTATWEGIPVKASSSSTSAASVSAASRPARSGGGSRQGARRRSGR